MCTHTERISIQPKHVILYNIKSHINAIQISNIWEEQLQGGQDGIYSVQAFIFNILIHI